MSASVHYYFWTKEGLGLVLIKRYSDRFFGDLEKRAAKSKTTKVHVKAFCKTYKRALKSSDKICLCGMLGAETCGLPENLGRAVAEFFDANIAWIFKVLPSSMPAKKTRAKAIQTVATLQGAMMLAASISDLKTFEAAVTPFLQTCDID